MIQDFKIERKIGEGVEGNVLAYVPIISDKSYFYRILIGGHIDEFSNRNFSFDSWKDILNFRFKNKLPFVFKTHSIGEKGLGKLTNFFNGDVYSFEQDNFILGNELKSVDANLENFFRSYMDEYFWYMEIPLEENYFFGRVNSFVA